MPEALPLALHTNCTPPIALHPLTWFCTYSCLLRDFSYQVRRPGYIKIDGRTPPHQRQPLVDAFQTSPDVLAAIVSPSFTTEVLYQALASSYHRLFSKTFGSCEADEETRLHLNHAKSMAWSRFDGALVHFRAPALSNGICVAYLMDLGRPFLLVSCMWRIVCEPWGDQ